MLILILIFSNNSTSETNPSEDWIGRIDIDLTYEKNDTYNVSNTIVVMEKLKQLGYNCADRPSDNISTWIFPLHKKLSSDKGTIILWEILTTPPEIFGFLSNFKESINRQDNNSLNEHKKILLDEISYVTSNLGIHFNLDNVTWNYIGGAKPPNNTDNTTVHWCWGIVSVTSITIPIAILSLNYSKRSRK